jgi:predicted TIM-barrel fold metal-dependent hydrolase
METSVIIDSDAHVVESAHTWDYMDPSEKQYRPIPLETREDAGVKLQFWVIDGKVKGFRFPAFSAAELEKRQQQVGRKFADAQESRELGNVDLRLEHMDQTGVDVQVLHNTMFIESATDRAAVEVALCKSWNRWLADIWRQGKGRLRWSCMAPTLSIRMHSIRSASPKRMALAPYSCVRSKAIACLQTLIFIRSTTKRAG